MCKLNITDRNYYSFKKISLSIYTGNLTYFN